MAKFILYLIESGMCLTLLYLAYILFLRKETYFNFNRIYLLGIMIVALVIPLLHITVAVAEKDDIEETFQDIGKFRSYYTGFIAMAESEFGQDRYRSYEAAVFEDSYLYNETDVNANVTNPSGKVSMVSQNMDSMFKGFNILRIFIIIYLLGVLFFFTRLVVLLFWLAKMVKQNPKEAKEGYKLVLMEKEIPPFSFFKYIFINKNATQLTEYEQVLAHEQVHVGQMHSLDLIIAHAITVFQWFNPLVWNLQKALKTTHEYIADSKVVNQGFELFDYQSLLLSQLVSIQSVELVNNFNLISIKKRIAMMTKNKSRFSAKLKALIIIPMALVSFFLFAHMTVKSPVLNFTNYSAAKVSNLDGIWENSSDTFGKLLLFNGTKLSILESADKVDVIDLGITIKDKELQINRFGHGTESLKYLLTGSELKIWWNDTDYTSYRKTNFKNSFEVFKLEAAGNIDLPIAVNTKILDKVNLVIDVYVLNDKYIVDGESCTFENLKSTFSKKAAKFNKLDRAYVTTRIVSDQNTEMGAIFQLYMVLRELRYYRIAYGSLPDDGASPLQYHSAGLAQLLPPTEADGAKILQIEDIEDGVFALEPGGNLKQKKVELEEFIKTNPSDIISFVWNNSTRYGNYIATIDMVFDVLYGYRDQYALEKYNIMYTELPKNLQKEVRKQYPMRLSQRNSDEETNN